MDIRHLRYFLAVAEELNFSRAAKRLHMSQPPLSKRISDLESEFGVQLFDRRSKRVVLTPAGQDLVPCARQAVASFDAATTCLIRVGFTPDTSVEVLSDLSTTLRGVGINFELVESTTAEQHALLLNGGLYIGVLFLPFSRKGLWSSPPFSRHSA